MYATAQRVVSPNRGAEGINVFHYLHGSYHWEGPPPTHLHPEHDTGTLVGDAVDIAPPGNRVRSYLDVVAPDETPVVELARAVGTAAAAWLPERFPETFTTGNVWVRFGVEAALLPVWRHEFRLLLDRITSLVATHPNT